jgi:hypothetical protein
MRRLLLSLGLAAVVGGSVLGAAATLSINPTSLAAGGTVVASCDTGTASITTEPAENLNSQGFYLYAIGVWELDHACYGRPVQVTATEDGVSLGEAAVFQWLDYGDPVFGAYLYAYFPDTTIDAVDVNDIHVVIQ